MSKFVSISDTLKSFLESFTASFIVRTHVKTCLLYTSDAADD